MKALVVYESIYGNTRRVAEAVAEGLARHGHVDLVEVSQAELPVPDDVDLMVIGGPTHAYGMSRPKTRQNAVRQAADPAAPTVPTQPGIREWIARLSDGGRRVDTAVFDTRLSRPAWLTGSAARRAAKRIRRTGIPLAAAPASFTVTGATGPLSEGELDRARRWGDDLGTNESQAQRTFGPFRRQAGNT